MASILTNSLQPVVPFLIGSEQRLNHSMHREPKTPLDKSSLPTLLHSMLSWFAEETSDGSSNLLGTTRNTKLFALMLPVVMLGSSLDGCTMTFADFGALSRIRTLSPHSNIGMQRGVGPAGIHFPSRKHHRYKHH